MYKPNDKVKDAINFSEVDITELLLSVEATIFYNKKFTVVTTNTRPQRFFSPGSNLRFGGRQSTVTMVFKRWSRADSFPVSRALARTCLRLSPFSNIFATESGTASCPEEEYEFVECLSAETQIIDLFTHSKLQPHKLSQCALAARLSSY